MKAHSVKSNAKRAARKFCEGKVGFEPVEPVLGKATGNWFAAVRASEGAALETASGSVIVTNLADFADEKPTNYRKPVTPTPTKPKPTDLPRPPAPSAETVDDDEAAEAASLEVDRAIDAGEPWPAQAIDAKFAANREALSSFKLGDRVEFDQPGTFRQPDNTTREGRLVVGVVVKVLDKEQGTLKVVEDSGPDWSVGASVLRSAAPVFDLGSPEAQTAATEGVAAAVETIKINETAKTVAAVKSLPPPVKSTPEEVAARRAERRERMDAEKAAGIRDSRGNLKPTGKPARPETKAALIIRLVNRPKGATMEELMGATGWQRHTLRGYIGGTLRKNGHRIVAARAKGDEPTRYTIAPVEPAESAS